jgi:hypothetical protein
VKVAWAPSLIASDLLAPAGASLIALIVMLSVLAEASRSWPPLAVPPLSCTWNRTLPVVVLLGVGTKRTWPLVMTDSGSVVPAMTGLPLNVSVPPVAAPKRTAMN